MLSAVENFNPAAAAATHTYAHHHQFAIAAAAAAAGSAAAAAAAVIPSQQQQQQQQTLLENHHTLSHSASSLISSQTLSNSGLLLPPNQLPALPSSESTIRRTIPTNLSPSSSSSTNINNKNLNNSAQVAVAMSSAEFARPHPKQPRYSTNTSSSSSNNNNNNIINNNNINHNNNNTISNNNGSSNGIPLHLRNNKIGSSCLSNTSSSTSSLSSNTSVSSSRTKYSTDQSAPVNLVTNNNSNINSNSNSIHNSINSTPSPPIRDTTLDTSSGQLPPPPPPPTVSQQSATESEMMSGMYTPKLQFLPSDPLSYHLSYSRILNRTGPYGTPSLYPSHLSYRGQIHNRPTYINEPYTGYLSTVSYSPTGVPSTLRQPPVAPPAQQINLGSPHGTSSLPNSSHSNQSNSALCTTQLPGMPDPRHPPQPLSHHHMNQPQLISAERQPQISHLKEKESSKNPIYLNGKINSNSTVPVSTAGFKVPSGKEGSLKHRILTRPTHYGEKDARRRSPTTPTVVRYSSNNNSPTNFKKGSLIELSSGELRRVEDMRTEDFVQSAERSQHLELADSTVVKISNTPSCVIITFSYNKNRSKVEIEAPVEHPFFVYGQGWASCNPDLSMKVFSLKCQHLQVGDVCISLKPRETPQYPSTPHSPISSAAYPSAPQHYKDDLSPQNLSRKPNPSSVNSCLTTTIPTTATGIAVTSKLAPMLPHNLPPPMQQYEILHPYTTTSPPQHHSHHLSPPNGIQHPHPQRLQKSYMPSLSRNNGDLQTTPPPSQSQSSNNCPPSSNQPYFLGISSGGGSGCIPNTIDTSHSTATSSEHQAAMEASFLRKRRWSDPVNICDENGCPPVPHKTMSNS